MPSSKGRLLLWSRAGVMSAASSAVQGYRLPASVWYPPAIRSGPRRSLRASRNVGPVNSFRLLRQPPPSHAYRRLSRHVPGKERSDCGGLHHEAAAAALLRRVRVLSPGDGAPDRRHHVVLRAVAVRDDAIDALVANSLRRHDAQLQRREPINRTFSPRCSRGSAPYPNPPEAGCSALLGVAA